MLEYAFDFRGFLGACWYIYTLDDSHFSTCARPHFLGFTASVLVLWEKRAMCYWIIYLQSMGHISASAFILVRGSGLLTLQYSQLIEFYPWSEWDGWKDICGWSSNLNLVFHTSIKGMPSKPHFPLFSFLLFHVLITNNPKPYQTRTCSKWIFLGVSSAIVTVSRRT